MDMNISNEELANQVRKKFIDFFHEEPLLFRSPGRVNIIGEHTDYNEGFVLPVAIDKSIITAIGKRKDGEIHLHSIDFEELYITTLDTIKREPSKWTNYVLGVVAQLLNANHIISGFNLVVGGNIPIGAGLSSSAAMECSVAQALNTLFKLDLSTLKLARLAQQAEHEFAGVNCGIMDQFASVFGKKDHAIRLDCRSMEYHFVPLDLRDYKIVLLNTSVKHSLASSEYNTRRMECEQGVKWIRQKYPYVMSLRDADREMVEECISRLDEVVYRRCRYIVEENNRLHLACEKLRLGNIVDLGQLMYASHKGLSEDYEVSCRELDWLVNAVRDFPGVAGARMMGGGFGGCTINIVKENAIRQITEELSERYRAQTGLELEYYVAETDNGTSEITIDKYQRA